MRSFTIDTDRQNEDVIVLYTLLMILLLCWSSQLEASPDPHTHLGAIMVHNDEVKDREQVAKKSRNHEQATIDRG